MDLFLDSCQGVGLALAAGMLVGAPGPEGDARRAVMLIAAIAGAALFVASLSGDDHPAWPGVIPGGALGAFAAIVTSAIVAGAGRRAEGARGGIALQVVGGAFALGLLSLLLPPVSLLFLAGALWLWYARRGREERKHEGLRVLR